MSTQVSGGEIAIVSHALCATPVPARSVQPLLPPVPVVDPPAEPPVPVVVVASVPVVDVGFPVVDVVLPPTPPVFVDLTTQPPPRATGTRRAAAKQSWD